MQVLPKHSLYPTSVRAFDQFRRVQDAYECLIKPESREKYDAMLQELEAEERSLFGERKARRQVQEQEQQNAQKSPPPFVWNEDTNTPLFWTPGRKLIEGPKPEGDMRPVAYYRRASLDKALVLASAESSSDSSKSSVATSKQLTGPRHSIQSAPAPTLVPAALPAPAPFYTIPSVKLPPKSITTLVSFTPSAGHAAGQTKRRFSQPQPVPFTSAMDTAQLQRAQMQAIEERHRRKVETERMKAMHELEKRRRAVEKEQRRKMQIEEDARRMVERERENRIIEAEKLRHKQEKENLKREKENTKRQQKQVRWAVTDAVFDPVPEYHAVETGPYYDGWFSEPELPRTRPKVLRKRRPVA
ncbi:hypothetical protein FRC14_006165 [Serendipita sp. 396]|nr:hypothetical protein FRC14_006165 [Serendipita sp. 396]KAG8779392.1 hypothetical protein FRC15_010218 [Serendipita sp. 397]KAG8866598.1 hypothetical protein FRC20_008045 [Serendipita sp. 405]